MAGSWKSVLRAKKVACLSSQKKYNQRNLGSEAERKRRVRRVSPINVGGGLSLVLTVPSGLTLEKVCEIIILDERLQKSKSVNIQN